MKPKTLVWVVGLVGITVLILAACGAAATPTPTTAPTKVPPTNTPVPPPTNTPAPTNTPVPPTPTPIPSADNCVACHTNAESLQKLAVEKKTGSAETEGEG